MRALVAECIGTALLLTAVVGSGIMGARLADGNVAVALLANAIATGTALSVLILMLGPVSGAHFNPVVTLVDMVVRRGSVVRAAGFTAAQLAGAVAGVIVAHVMFGERWWQVSTQVRSGWPLIVSEGIATFGLIAVITSVSQHRPTAMPAAVGGYITAAYWFTASTSFANPAVTIARTLTDTVTGIRPADVAGFVAAQAVGAVVGASLLQWLLQPDRVTTHHRVDVIDDGNRKAS